MPLLGGDDAGGEWLELEFEFEFEFEFGILTTDEWEILICELCLKPLPSCPYLSQSKHANNN